MNSNKCLIELLESRRLLALDTPSVVDALIVGTVPVGVPKQATQVATKLALSSAVAGATEYLTEISTAPTGPWTPAQSFFDAGSVSIFHIQNLAGQKYYFKVRATNGSEYSQYSTPKAPRTPYDNVVQAEVDTSQSTATALQFKWPVNSAATAYHVHRLIGTTWSNVKSITSNAATSSGIFITSQDWPGLNTSIPTEVRVSRQEGAFTFYGYLRAGKDIQPIHSRGDVLLVIDRTVVDTNTSLHAADEVNQLKADLIGEGWRVHSLLVDRDFEDYRPLPNGQGSDRGNVVSIKNQIKSIASQPGVSLKSILLVGHVPIPMSSTQSSPDGHNAPSQSHHGAWVADSYYGDLVNDNLWADTGQSLINARFSLQNNIVGDKKFDQAQPPSAIEAAVGRIDFYRMVDFAQVRRNLNTTSPLSAQLAILREEEIHLIKEYLAKNHAWRIGTTTVTKRAIVDDNMSHDNGQSAKVGWRLAANVGASLTSSTDYLALTQEGATYAFGASAGGLDINMPITEVPEAYPNIMYDPREFLQAMPSPTNYPNTNFNLNGVFNFAYGSWVGNWWKPNSMLRGMIADPNSAALTSTWTDIDKWFAHAMAIGEPIGSSLLTSLNNNSGVYHITSGGLPGAYTSLLGDATLRQDNIRPVSDVKVSTHQVGYGSTVPITTHIEWAASPDSNLNYIYRAASPEGPFSLINSMPVSGTSYEDVSSNPNGETYYMVRAAKLETSGGSGTYWNLSTGQVSRRLVNVSNFKWNEPPQEFTFQFNQVITGLETADFSIEGLKWDTQSQSLIPWTFSPGTHFEWVIPQQGSPALRFIGENERGVDNTLPSGKYTVTVEVAATSSIGQSLISSHSYDILYLSGDIDNDGDVDFNDLLVVTQHYGQSGNWPNSFEYGDFNNDGLVNFDDLIVVSQYYGFDWVQ